VHIAAPEKLQPHPEVQAIAQHYAQQSGATIMITDNVQQAVYHTDVLYTDVWVSMGTDESEWGTRIENMLPYQINDTLLAQADNPDLIV
ncbi:ornithine carbamoyltransferase, partial [Staphylococcus simulans]